MNVARDLFAVGCDAGPERYIPEGMKPQQCRCGDVRSCRLVLIQEGLLATS